MGSEREDESKKRGFLGSLERAIWAVSISCAGEFIGVVRELPLGASEHLERMMMQLMCSHCRPLLALTASIFAKNNTLVAALLLLFESALLEQTESKQKQRQQ